MSVAHLRVRLALLASLVAGGAACAPLAAQGIRGMWIDAGGNNITIEQHGAEVMLRTSRGWEFRGALTGQRAHLTRKYQTLDDTPEGMSADERRWLVGETAALDLTLWDDTLGFEGTLVTSVERSNVPRAPAKFVRRPLIDGVAIVAESYRTLLERIDRQLPWARSIHGDIFEGQRNARVLLVWGRYLPRERVVRDGGVVRYVPVGAEWRAIRSLDPAVEYSVLETNRRASVPGYQPTTQFVTRISPVLWRETWDAIREQLGPDSVARIQQRDAMLVLAGPAPNALPGYKRFRVNGADAEWLLNAGTMPAQLAFVRRGSGDRLEPAEALLLFDTVHLQIRLRDTLSLPEFPIVLGLNGRVLAPGGQQAVMAARTKDDATLYLTPLLLFHPPGQPPAAPGAGTIPIPAATGDTVFASLRDTTAVQARPPSISVPVVFSPADSGFDAAWLEALAEAAQLDGVAVPPDLTSAARMEVDRLTTVVVTELGTRHVSLSLGHHAAMLLLRRYFLGMMRDYAALLRQRVVASPAALRGIMEVLRPAMADPNYPLGRVEVAAPGGMLAGKVPLRVAFEKDPFNSNYLHNAFTSRSQAESWLIDAMREGIQTYLAAVEHSIEHAEGTNVAKLKPMLELTGQGFGPVVQRLLPRLLLRVPEPPPSREYRWIPSADARRAVLEIAGKAAELKANQELGAADTQVLLAIAALVPVAAPASLGRTIFSAALGVTDAALAGSNWYAESREVEFARGASAVLGSDRLDVAEASRTPLWANLLALAGAGIGIGSDVLQGLSEIGVSLARSRADRLLARFEAGGLDALARMSKQEKQEFLVALFDARAAAKAERELSATQRRLLGAADQLETEARTAASRAATREAVERTPAAMRDGIPPDMRGRLPIAVDEALDPNTVRVLYDRDASGAITNIRLSAAPGASAADIAAHAGTARLMERYAASAAESGDLLRRLKAYVGRFGEPPVGSLAWEAQLELEKLPRLIVDDRLARLQAGGLTAAETSALLDDINHLGEQMSGYRKILDDWNVNPGRGYVAAEGRTVAMDEGGRTTTLERTAYREREATAAAVADVRTRVATEARELGALEESVEDAALTRHVHDHVVDILGESNAERFRTLTGPLRDNEVVQAAGEALDFLDANVSATARDRLLRTPGSADLLADLGRTGTAGTGGRYHVRLAGELIDEGRGLRVLEDKVPSPPKYQMAAEREPGRVIRKGADMVTTDGEVIQAKSFAQWDLPYDEVKTPFDAVTNQAISDLVRYADLGWKDGTGRYLNGVFTYYIDRQALGAAATAARVAEAATLSTDLTRWARGAFRRQVTVRVVFR